MLSGNGDHTWPWFREPTEDEDWERNQKRKETWNQNGRWANCAAFKEFYKWGDGKTEKENLFVFSVLLGTTDIFRQKEGENKEKIAMHYCISFKGENREHKTKIK